MMEHTDNLTLDPREIRELFHRHPGTIRDLAKELGVKTQTISGYLAGRPRKNVQERAKRLHEGIQAKALQLLGAEHIKEQKAS